MKRADFLKLLAVAPLVRLDKLGEAPATESDALLGIVRLITEVDLGYDVPACGMIRLAQTCDARKYAVWVEGASGFRAHKETLVSGFAQAASRNSEVAYQLTKSFKECGRDIAYAEKVGRYAGGTRL